MSQTYPRPGPPAPSSSLGHHHPPSTSLPPGNATRASVAPPNQSQYSSPSYPPTPGPPTSQAFSSLSHPPPPPPGENKSHYPPPPSSSSSSSSLSRPLPPPTAHQNQNHVAALAGQQGPMYNNNNNDNNNYNTGFFESNPSPLHLSSSSSGYNNSYVGNSSSVSLTQTTHPFPPQRYQQPPPPPSSAPSPLHKSNNNSNNKNNNNNSWNHIPSTPQHHHPRQPPIVPSQMAAATTTTPSRFLPPSPPPPPSPRPPTATTTMSFAPPPPPSRTFSSHNHPPPLPPQHPPLQQYHRPPLPPPSGGVPLPPPPPPSAMGVGGRYPPPPPSPRYPPPPPSPSQPQPPPPLHNMAMRTTPAATTTTTTPSTPTRPPPPPHSYPYTSSTAAAAPPQPLYPGGGAHPPPPPPPSLAYSPYPPPTSAHPRPQAPPSPGPAVTPTTQGSANPSPGNTSSSIDPSQLPRVPVFTRPQDDDNGQMRIPIYQPKAGMMQASPVYPPPADSRFLVQDDGNASPEMIRSSLYRIPIDRRVWHHTGDLPMGVVCTPMAVHSAQDCQPRPRRTLNATTTNSTTNPNPSANDHNVAVLQEEEETWTEYGGGVPLIPQEPVSETNHPGTKHSKTTTSPVVFHPPPRCSNCDAYVNPYFVATDGLCNFCHSRNPKLNCLHLCQTGHPAMHFGTVDYAVSGPYLTRDRPVEPVHLYALDLSMSWSQIPAYLAILEQVGQDLFQHAQRQQEKYLLQTTNYFDRNPTMAPPPPPKIGLCFFCATGILVRQKSITTPDHPGRYVLMPDISKDPFSPLPLDEWTYPMSNSNNSNSATTPTTDALESWKLFLDEMAADLEGLKQQARQRTSLGLDGLELSCGGAAAQFLAHALAETGGRGTVWTWRRPNVGVGSIPHREQVFAQGKIQGTYKTCTPLQFQSHLSNTDQAAADFYKNLAIECSKNRIAIDFLLHTSFAMMDPPPFLDLATLGEFCNQTCGQLIWVSSHDWQDNLYQELSRQVQSVTAYDAVFKLRCSSGLQVKKYYAGSGTVIEGALGASPEIELTQVSPATSIAVELDHRVGGISKDSTFAYVQSALLYSTATGARRVRVSTLALRTTAVVDEVFQSVDFNTTMTLVLREAVARLLKPQPSSATTESEKELIRISTCDAVRQQCLLRLASYREHGNPAVLKTPLSQLVLPEKLQLYPLFCMSLLKSPMLRAGFFFGYGGESNRSPSLSPTADERAFFQWHAARCHPAITLTLVHPMVYSLTGDSDKNNDNNNEEEHNNSDHGWGDWQVSEDPNGTRGVVRMPPPSIASMAILSETGIYLIDTGLGVYVVVGQGAPPECKAGWESLLAAQPKVGRLLWQIRAFSSSQRGPESEGLRPTYAPVTYVVLTGIHDKRQTQVFNLLLDDAVCGEKSLPDFLVHLHQKIRERVSQVKK